MTRQHEPMIKLTVVLYFTIKKLTLSSEKDLTVWEKHFCHLHP
jgi:hypothetical protein